MSQEKQFEVDIAGTMATPIDNWQKRTEGLAKPEYWSVTAAPSVELWQALTLEERVRLDAKVEMVINATKYLLAGMVKGTVKYTSDDWTLDRWMAHVIGEGADQFNYQILMFNTFLKEKKEREEQLIRIKRAWEGGGENVSSDSDNSGAIQRKNNRE